MSYYPAMSGLPLLAEALRTKKHFRIGLARQFWEATRLRWSDTRLDPWEYYFFQVFLDRFSMQEKRGFIGWRREIELDRRLNTGPERQIANDKLRFQAFMHERDVPLPRLAAAYRTEAADIPATIRLTTAADVARYLSTTGDYPLFVKPARGARGRDAHAVRGVSGDRLELTSGNTISLQDFVAKLAEEARRGVLFQECLPTHASVADICGDRLTSVRLVVLVEDDTPRILSAAWRVPTGTNVSDNFSCGFSGNLIAGVDLASGEISNVIQGVGWQNRPVASHPDTGTPFRDLRLPEWDATRDVCLECSAQFTGLHLQHWDIALTDRGPVVLELNVEGGLRTHQIVAGGPATLRALATIRT